MGRLVEEVGFYVKVVAEPSTWVTLGKPRTALDQEFQGQVEMVEAIKRHVDNITSIEVESITEAKCSFCGYPWEESANSPHNGGCCEQDAENIPEQER